jgi:hypothetical protein
MRGLAAPALDYSDIRGRDGFQTQTDFNRPQFFMDLPTGPFYG